MENWTIAASSPGLSMVCTALGKTKFLTSVVLCTPGPRGSVAVNRFVAHAGLKSMF